MEMEEFTEALEKLRSIAADIKALEKESLKLVRSHKKHDDKEEDEECKIEEEEEEDDDDKGEEDCEETCKGDAKALGKKQTPYEPRRLTKRGAGYPGSNQIPLYQVMNYQLCPKQEREQPSDLCRPRLRRNKDRTSLKEQIEASEKRLQNAERQKEQCGCRADQPVSKISCVIKI